MTLVGPHRDDLSFWIDAKPARLFASEGQKKTAIASLRLAEWTRLAPASPLMAIDDLGLSLDTSRQACFRDKLATLGQVFITTPTPFEGFSAHLIQVRKGNFLFQ